MELYQLRTFVAVAEEGNFTRAGKRVHATQPAVSAHIKALEEELGVRLFDRVTRGVELTQAGAELVQDAIEVLAAANALAAKAVTLGGEVSGQFALGLCAEPDYLHVITILSRMSERFPRLNMKLVQSPSGVILSEVRARNLDAGFIFSGNPYSDLEAVKLADPTYCIMGASAWKKELAAAGPEELSAYTWMLPTSSGPFRDLQLEIFKGLGIAPARTIVANSEEVAWSLIAEGKALGLVREDGAARMVEQGVGVECAAVGRHPVELNFIYRKARADDPALAALVRSVRAIWSP